MLRITDRERDAMLRILKQANEFVREQAAEHSYRAEACGHVGERILKTHHSARSDIARQTADAVKGLILGLERAPRVDGRVTGTRQLTEKTRPPRDGV